MLSKESKIRALENFYALDYVFFGKSINEVETCCPLVKEEYLSIKGALLSVFVEMIKLVGHTPKGIEERVDSKMLIKNAKYSATHARENAQRIVSSDKSRNNIKEAMRAELKDDKNLDITNVVEQKIREKAFGLAVDNLLLARVVSESKKFDALNEWEGKLIEDSYKILRDNLVESAYQVLYNDEVLEEENVKEFIPAAPIATVAAVVTIVRKKCKKKFPNDAAKYKECIKSYAKKVKKESKNEVFEGVIGDIRSSIKKDKEIAKSNKTPAQKKMAWARHLMQLCKSDAARKNWPPEKLQKCIAKAKAKAK